MTLVSNFITFPEAGTFPAGPYDLDELMIAENKDHQLQFTFQLGFVYDIYLLKIHVKKPASWELWHHDSAVMHVESVKVADCPLFHCNSYFTDCEFTLTLQSPLMKKKVKRIHINTDDSTYRFAILLELESDEYALFTPDGIRFVEPEPSESSWPSDEWKDWNTM